MNHPVAFTLWLVFAVVIASLWIAKWADAASFGYNGSFYADGGDQIVEAKDGGASAIRYGISWSSIQPDKDGPMNWTWADEVYQHALAQGIRPVILLQGSPCWARTQTPCGSLLPNSTSHYDDAMPGGNALPEWGQFVAAATARYPKARAFEIWNEPNLPIFGGKYPTIDRYRSVLRVAYDNAAPGARILYGGLCPCGNWLDWLSAAYHHGGAGHTSDGLAIHIYPNPGLPWVATATKSIANAYRASDKQKVWITEIGESTHFVSDDRQAHDLVGLWDRIERRRWVKNVDIFSLRDQAQAASNQTLRNLVWTHVGVETIDGIPKPAYYALQNAVTGSTP